MTATLALPEQLRFGTEDADIWQAVVLRDEYQTGDLAGRTVLDIGGHVGSFAFRCLEAGARQVISLEPCQRSAAVYAAILADELAAERCLLLRAAAWREHGQGWLTHCPLPGATAGHTLILHHGPGEACRLIPLERLLEVYCPDAVKLDCEGAEYPLLVTAELPATVTTLWVEFHETLFFRTPFAAILERLAAAGFVARLLKVADANIKLFRFDRPGVPS